MKSLSLRWLAVTLVPSVAILAVVAAEGAIRHVPISTMTRDVTTLAELHPLTGALSNLGILLWCAAASICLFTAFAVRNRASKEALRFLLFSALLSLYLLFDDFFLFHDSLAPWCLGVDERVVYGILGVAVLIYFVAFWRVMLRTEYVLLLIALCLLASSVFVDVTFERWQRRFGDWGFFFEDGAKWLGIACWCSYFVRTSFQYLVGGPGLSCNAVRSDAGAAHRRWSCWL